MAVQGLMIPERDQPGAGTKEATSSFIKLGNYFLNRHQITHVEFLGEVSLNGSSLNLRSATVYLAGSHQGSGEPERGKRGSWLGRLFGSNHHQEKDKAAGYQLHFSGKEAQTLRYWLMQDALNLDEMYQKWEAKQFDTALASPTPTGRIGARVNGAARSKTTTTKVEEEVAAAQPRRRVRPNQSVETRTRV